MMQKQREPFFKPFNTDQHFSESSSRIQNRSKLSQNIDQEDNGGERLNSLHAKLHQEADKIRKWKNQAELELKQKNKKIQESTKTVECLRKSILDLQLKNENLSMSLQEEISNREDILQRVGATRTLCSALKDHLTQAETKISQCVEEKCSVQQQEENHKVQFELLSDKFNGLELASNEQQKKLREQLTTITKEKTDLDEKLRQKSLEADEQLKILNLQLDDKNIEIRDIRVQVQKNNDKIHLLEKDITTLKSQLQQSNEQLSGAREEHEELNKKFHATEAVKAQLEQELCDCKDNIQQINSFNKEMMSGLASTKAEHEQQVEILKAELDEQTLQLNQKRTKVHCLEIDLEKANTLLEEVKSSKDMLIMEKAELENRLTELERQNVGMVEQAELVLQHEENCVSLSQMSGNIQDLQGQLASSQHNGAALLFELNEIKAQLHQRETEKLQLDDRIKILESDVDVRQTGITDIQKELADKTDQIVTLKEQIKSLHEDIKTERNKHKNTVSELKTCEGQLTRSEKEIGVKLKEIERLSNDVEKLNLENKETKTKLEEMEKSENTLRDEISELQSELTSQKEVNESLMDDRQHSEEAIQGKLLSKEKAASDLEAKNKSLKSDMAAKTKQIKELEKELRTLKSKIIKENKSLESKDMKLSELKIRLEAETTLKSNLQSKLLEQEESLEGLQNALVEAEKQAQESKEIADQCLSENEAMHKQCEGQRSEMSAIMLNYKTDHEKSLQKKDKDIETLNSKLKTIQNKLKKEMEEKESKYQKEIEQLRNTVSKSGYQMESLQKNFGEKENKLQKLEQENCKKDEELRSLQEKVENMFIKSNTSTASPLPTKSTPSNFQTPQIQAGKDPTKTPQILRTPSNLKTPQRSILKPSAESSAMKKRRVVFAANEDHEESDSEESSAFELDLQEGAQVGKHCVTPVLVKQSPKVRTPNDKTVRYGKKMNTAVPPIRSSKDQFDLLQTKHADGSGDSKSLGKKKDKTKSMTEKPAQSYSKFFKNSLKRKTMKAAEKDTSLSWFENDDVFGFNAED